MIANHELLTSLRERVRAIETSARPSTRCCSLGCAVLDRMAPDGGLLAGTIHEWFGVGGAEPGALMSARELVSAEELVGVGAGVEILSLLAAREACRDGGTLVVLDAAGDFYPPAAARWGIDLSRTIFLRGEMSAAELAWGIDQALQTSSVGAVWGRVGDLDERWLRRFQLSAEQSGCVGLFLRPAMALRRPSWCEARWLCRPGLCRPGLCRSEPDASAGRSGAGHSGGLERRLRVDLIRARGARAGLSAELRLDFERGAISGELRHGEAISLPLARQLAHPATRRRAARA